MTNEDDLYANQVLELRRGTIVLAVFSELKKPRYGYELLQRLKEIDMAIDAGTLYPQLRRFEKQGILTSYWDTSEARPRKYYQLSKQGVKLYKHLKDEWVTISNKITYMIQGE
ncbi:MAG TPA: PadR family transcriptional regulator [Candidatus Saccharimonadales bacterium]|nr:PadR family transcriptional regulator [Candidatus Saccharimonadales bacterium]